MSSLQRRIENLTFKNKRYDQDIALLSQERENLTEQVHQLENLLSKRDLEVIEAEKLVHRSQRKIDWLIDRAH